VTIAGQNAAAMNTETLQSGLVSLGIIAQNLHTVRRRLPTTEESTLLATVELDLKIAKATIARGMGYALCRHCWPPDLMVQAHGAETSCRQCGRKNSPSEANFLDDVELRQFALWKEAVSGSLAAK
jgi:hypothetical protein